jgi:hypothetical protein
MKSLERKTQDLFLARSASPRAGECILSWIARLCAFVPVSMTKFFEEIAGAKYTDLDWKYDEGIASKIAAAAWVPTATVRDLRTAFERRSAEDLLPMIRAVPAASFAICPWCLKDDEVPYFRQAWRVRLVKVCEIHRLALTERCPHCSRKVHLKASRVSMERGAGALRFCQECGGDLTARIGLRIDDTSFHELAHLQRDWAAKLRCSGHRYWDSNIPFADAQVLKGPRAFDLHEKYSVRDFRATTDALLRARERSVVALRVAQGKNRALASATVAP